MSRINKRPRDRAAIPIRREETVARIRAGITKPPFLLRGPLSGFGPGTHIPWGGARKRKPKVTLPKIGG